MYRTTATTATNPRPPATPPMITSLASDESASATEIACTHEVVFTKSEIKSYKILLCDKSTLNSDC